MGLVVLEDTAEPCGAKPPGDRGLRPEGVPGLYWCGPPGAKVLADIGVCDWTAKDLVRLVVIEGG